MTTSRPRPSPPPPPLSLSLSTQPRSHTPPQPAAWPHRYKTSRRSACARAPRAFPSLLGTRDSKLHLYRLVRRVPKSRETIGAGALVCLACVCGFGLCRRLNVVGAVGVGFPAVSCPRKIYGGGDGWCVRWCFQGRIGAVKRLEFLSHRSVSVELIVFSGFIGFVCFEFRKAGLSTSNWLFKWK